MTAVTTPVQEERSAGRRVAPLLAATGLSITGDSAFNVAAPLIAASITRSPLAVASVTVAEFAVWILIGLPAGAITDRLPRRKVMIVSDLARVVILAVLTVLVVTRHDSIPVLIGAVAALSVGSCFFNPASMAIIPAVTGTDVGDLKKINGWFWSARLGGQALIGPPVGSVTFAAAPALPVIADALSFLGSAWLVRRLPEVPPGPAAGQENVGRAVVTGVRYALAHPDLRAVIGGVGGFNLATTCSEATLVLYVREVLGLPAWTFGPLIAAAAVGGMLTGLRAEAITRRFTVRQGMAAALALQGAAWALLAATGQTWVAVVSMALIGVATSVSNVTGSTAIQVTAAGEFLGRVMSAWQVTAAAAIAVGALLGGLVAARFGLPATLGVSAVIAALSAAVLLLLRRRPGPS